jgi:replicative DNA helicase
MIEIEGALIGLMIKDADVFHDVSSRLNSSYFSHPETKEIFEVILSLANENSVLDEPIIKSRLQPSSKEAYNDYVKWQLADPANYDEYVSAIIEKKKSSDLFQDLSRICIGIKNGEPFEETVANAEQSIINASEQVIGSDSVSLGEYFEEFESLIRSERTAGIYSTINYIDHLTNGFHPGQLIIVAGRPSMGKSAFAIQIALCNAYYKDVPFAIYSLEMTKKDIMERIVGMIAEIETWKLRNGKLSETDWAKFKEIKEKMRRTPFYMEEPSSLNIATLKAKAKKLKMKHPNLGGIVVDYLQLMESPSMAGNKVQEISDISRGLKVLAKDLKIPVIAVSQLSRAVEQRENKRPILSDLRESGSIEQDADCVLFLYRDDYYTQENDTSSLVEINLSKHRNGPIGVAKAIFKKNFQQFVNTVSP